MKAYLYSFREKIGDDWETVTRYELVYAHDVFDALAKLKRWHPHIDPTSFINHTIL
jgi:hypothetical protein